MAKPAIAAVRRAPVARTSASPAVKEKSRRKTFRIARWGQTARYSVDFLGDGNRWEPGVLGLTLKQAQAQLVRLKDMGCPIREEIAIR